MFNKKKLIGAIVALFAATATYAQTCNVYAPTGNGRFSRATLNGAPSGMKGQLLCWYSPGTSYYKIEGNFRPVPGAWQQSPYDRHYYTCDSSDPNLCSFIPGNV
ncbi:MAG: hypothetical protein H0W64_01300 [Gammaproteobacteria bacterium]|nr:hypothetical protein [Gammaproteobacteria bacterium]